MNNAKSSTPKDDASVVSGMGKRALQFLLTQSTNGQEDTHEAQPVKKRGGRKKAPQKLPPQTTGKRKALEKNSSNNHDNVPSSALEKNDDVSIATGAGRNALLSLLSMAEGKNDDNIPSNALEQNDEVSIATGVGKNALLSLLSMAEGNSDDNVPIKALEKNDEVSISTGAGKNALLSSLSMADGNNDDNVPINALEKNDEVSISTGAGKNALLALLSTAERNNVSELLENGSVSSDESVMNNAKSSTPKDDASVVSGMGKRALQFLLTQSTNGQEDTHEAQPVKKRSGREKAPQTMPPQTTRKPQALKKDAKAKSSKKEDLHPETSVRGTTSNAVKEKQTEHIVDVKDDDGISMNASAVTGMSSDEEFSVATEGAGRNALASLLSKCKEC